MKNPKSIFYLIYFLFHVVFLGVAIFINLKSEDFEFLLKMRSNIGLMTYAAVFGLVLFGINMLLISMEARSFKSKMDKLENEKNSLKAKMFDLQEASSAKPSPASTGDVEEEEETK